MVSAYDSRLGMLVPYLKQLWMESLGKRVDRNGQPLHGPACPILWGDIGTDAQHAFFQLLHQGEQGVAVELIGVTSPEHGSMASHHALLANLLAQAQALARGHTDSDAAKACRGGHPISLVMLDRLDAATLGSLVALWEHRVLCMAALTDINPFDQWGVELGKSIAPAALHALAHGSPLPKATPLDGISQDVIAWLKSRVQ
jgi:glucose-6-phosphate isomerase